MTESRHTFTQAEQAYYDRLDEDVTGGRVPTIAHDTPRDGSLISDAELDAILRGRPSLGRDHATGGAPAAWHSEPDPAGPARSTPPARAGYTARPPRALLRPTLAHPWRLRPLATRGLPFVKR